MKGLGLGKVKFGGEGASYTVTQNNATALPGFAVINGMLTITAEAGLKAGTYDLVLNSSTSQGDLSSGTSQKVTVVVNDITVPSLTLKFNPDDGPQSYVIALPDDADGDQLTVLDLEAVKTQHGEYSVKDGVLSFTPFAGRDDGGTDTLALQVTDGRGGFAELTVTVTLEVGVQRVFNILQGRR